MEGSALSDLDTVQAAIEHLTAVASHGWRRFVRYGTVTGMTYRAVASDRWTLTAKLTAEAVG